ncbi:DUF1080 domain-containing protein [Seonamhaeicola sp.]|uniref:3-keto-disaccharide hydrolase n=1 Tax=Seonamhaeicola sp. TaxID=1912245 RepID=UPI002607C6B2|nr:DUF1080 domain-containing protein [Seonamhaeicola sp.]
MRTLLYILLTIVAFLSCKQKENKTDELKVQEPPQTAWKVLFDGTSFDNWRGYLKDDMPSAWSIEDDAMVLISADNSGNIITKNTYTNFILSLEWKISEGGNSGIFWGIHENENLGQPYETGPEIQVLDNERHPDAQANPKYHQAGALYDMVQPSKDVCKPAGEWNLCEIQIDHLKNYGSVTLNGTKIVEFPVHGQAWDALVANSKFSDWKHFGNYHTGHIGLQDHGDKVWYRNIKIKEL